MGNFEEKNNEDKEEMALFGSEDAEQIRILGCWLGPKADKLEKAFRILMGKMPNTTP